MPPTIGISSCLVGRAVRFDGGHKRNDLVMDVLSPHVRFVTVCPEVEMGLGTPRETLRLVRRGDDVRLIMATGEDHTEAMRRYADARVRLLAGEDLRRLHPEEGLTQLRVRARQGLRERRAAAERSGPVCRRAGPPSAMDAG